MDEHELAGFIDSAPQSTEIILSNLRRASELISNFKLVAVDVSSEMVRELNLLEYLGKVLQSLHPEIKRAKHEISVEGDNKLTIETYPGTISQIVTNLVMNSMVHAFETNSGGHIVIEVVRDGDNVRLTYGDDGKGMSEDVSRKIFEPFYTTRRGSGGSGLGMYLVYNLVTQTLNGDIRCTSEPGKGTTFVIIFPVEAKISQA